MHLGASHHQVRKVVDLALSLTIDWKEKSYFGLQNIYEINDCNLTWTATYWGKKLGIALLADSHCLQQIFINFFYFQFKKEKLFLKVKWKLCFDITDDFYRQRNKWANHDFSTKHFGFCCSWNVLGRLESSRGGGLNPELTSWEQGQVKRV